jgi:hypothetical protein
MAGRIQGQRARIQGPEPCPQNRRQRGHWTLSAVLRQVQLSKSGWEAQTVKTIAVIVLLAAVAVSGYLFYDWHTVVNGQQTAPPITLYYWQDPHGVVHVSESPPPRGTAILKKTEGYARLRQPLVLKLTASIRDGYRRLKARFAKSD